MTFGEFAGTEGDLVSGVDPAGQRPARRSSSTSARSRRVLPPQEQVPGETYVHGARLKCFVVAVRARAARARRSRCRAPTRTWSRSCSRSRCPRSPTASVEIAAIAREAGHRTKIAVRSTGAGVNAKGACIGPMGAAGPRR